MTISITNAGTNSNSSGASVAVTSVTSPSGAVILVGANELTTSTGGSVADTVNTPYTAMTAQFLNNSSTNGFGNVFYFPNAGALSGGTITYTKKTSGNKAAISALYVTGLATSSPLDTAVTAMTTGTGTSPSLASGSPASVAGEAVVAFLMTASATYTQDTTDNWAAPPTFVHGLAVGVGGGSQVNAGTGAITFAPTIASNPWAAWILGFTPASGTAWSGASTIAETTTVSASASLTEAASGAISGTATISAATTQIMVGSAALAGTAAVTSSATDIEAASATISGSATVTPSTKQRMVASAGLSGAATLSAAPVSRLHISPTISGVGSVSATTGIVESISSSIAGAGSVTPNTTQIMMESSALSGVATVSANATIQMAAAASIAGAGAVSALLNIQVASADLSGTATVSANAVVLCAASAGLSVNASCSTPAALTKSASANISGAILLSAVGALTKSAKASILGGSFVYAPVAINQTASASIFGSGFLYADGGLVGQPVDLFGPMGSLTLDLGESVSSLPLDEYGQITP